MDSWVSAIVGIFIVVMLLLIVSKLFRKKSKLGNLFTPFDDAVRGTDDANHHREEMTDTRQVAPTEQVEKKEERTVPYE